MPSIATLRLMNALESGLVTGTDLDTILADSAKLGGFKALLNMTGRMKRLANNSNALTAITTSAAAMNELTAHAGGMDILVSTALGRQKFFASSYKVGQGLSTLAGSTNSVLITKNTFADVVADDEALVTVAYYQKPVTAMLQDPTAAADFMAHNNFIGPAFATLIGSTDATLLGYQTTTNFIAAGATQRGFCAASSLFRQIALDVDAVRNLIFQNTGWSITTMLGDATWSTAFWGHYDALYDAIVNHLGTFYNSATFTDAFVKNKMAKMIAWDHQPSLSYLATGAMLTSMRGAGATYYNVRNTGASADCSSAPKLITSIGTGKFIIIGVSTNDPTTGATITLSCNTMRGGDTGGALTNTTDASNVSLNTALGVMRAALTSDNTNVMVQTTDATSQVISLGCFRMDI